MNFDCKFPTSISPDCTYYPPTNTYVYPWQSVTIPGPLPTPYVPTPAPVPLPDPFDTVKIRVVPKKDFDNPFGWLVVGHCHACGNPIYARVGDTSAPPKSHRTCNCK